MMWDYYCFNLQYKGLKLLIPLPKKADFSFRSSRCRLAHAQLPKCTSVLPEEQGEGFK